MTIDKISKIIENIRAEGQQKIEAFKKAHGLKHPGEIGSLYEKLTQNMISYGVPFDWQLKVTSGFIKNNDDSLSKQIDVLS